MNELLTTREVANIMSVNPETVRTWCRLGRIRAVRTLGGARSHWRIPREEILPPAKTEPSMPDMRGLSVAEKLRLYDEMPCKKQ
ncbi:MAG: helix-turn-helix domain-containing protein [Candidatus Latescibacteria bacterium]|nr:helix-turn-helix domain-containing protein [Candidatus Latescibacterota bacterium]